MPTDDLRDDIRQQLMHVSTATICTALFKQGLRNDFELIAVICGR